MANLREINYSNLENNFDFSTDIRLNLTTPMTIAVMNITADRNSVVPIVANIGWNPITIAPAEQRVDVLFELLQGNTVIASAISSAFTGEIRAFGMAHVDFDLPTRNAVYSLRARLLLAGSDAQIIGPITLYGQRIDR